MKITFAGHNFLLHPSGTLFWPEQSLLVVSDVHLEKGSHFAERGFFLPPYDSHETLERLHKTLLELSPKRLLILGDCFHDKKGHARLPKKERALFDELLSYSPIWIVGNHDGDFVPEGFDAYETFELGGISFRHEAAKDSGPEISGHFHPKIDLVHKGAFISRPCFVEDGVKMILPSFGAYTGGLSIGHKSIAQHFKTPPRTYIKGRDRIYFFNH